MERGYPVSRFPPTETLREQERSRLKACGYDALPGVWFYVAERHFSAERY